MDGGPFAGMFGANFAAGHRIKGELSVEGSVSLEFVLSSAFDAAFFGVNGGFSYGGGGQRGQAGVQFKFGVVVGAHTATEYTRRGLSFTMPLRGLPGWLRDKLDKARVNFQEAVENAGYRAIRFLSRKKDIPLPSWNSELRGDVLTYINGGIHDIAGNSYATVFLDYSDGSPFGIAFPYGLGNTASWNLSLSSYWEI